VTPAREEELGRLVERVREATSALMQGDVRRYRLVHRHADALVHPIGMEQLSLLARGSVGPR